MPPAASVLAFAVASVILIVIPGPSVLFTVGRALAYGRRTALATVCGNAAGNYLVASCVAVGLGDDRPALGPGVPGRPAGRRPLSDLARRCRRSASAASLAGAFATDAPGRSDRRAVREGFVVGVTNPKAYILFGAVLPQFVDRAAGHVPVQMLLLALISIAIGLVSDTTWALAAGGLRAWFARSPRRFALVGGAGGLAMIGVGISVAVTGRHN